MYEGKIKMTFTTCIIFLMSFCCASLALSEDSDEKQALAMKLANPLSDLISVPLQYNYDENYGFRDDGAKSYINIQPLIPFSLTEDWNLLSRTILPVISLDEIPSGNGETNGLGDITQSFFFAPTEPTSCGLTWGIGPVLLLPTATEELLGAEKWGAGPTVVVLKQSKPWTIGFLGNHIWSFAGEEQRDDVNVTLMQPFLAYVTKTYTTFSLNTESTYDWTHEQWSVPINFMVSQMLKIGGHPLSVGVGARYWADAPEGGPEDWGWRFSVTFLFPK